MLDLKRSGGLSGQTRMGGAAESVAFCLETGVMVTFDPPKWAIERVRWWAEWLAISHWSIHLQMAAVINRDEDVLGYTEQYPEINKATITLRADAEDTTDWHVVIVHELLHVSHTMVDYAVEDACNNYLETEPGQVVMDWYKLAYEQFTHRLAEAIVGNIDGGGYGPGSQ